MRDYSFQIEKKRLDDGAEKARLLDLVGGEIARRNLKSTDLKLIVPTISSRQVSDIRQGLRTAASLDRLRELAAGLGLDHKAAA